jgi:hypothetical protein
MGKGAQNAPFRYLQLLRNDYGQVPVRMSAPGPDFFHVSAPTVDWMQYVVDEADWTTMFLTPAS